MKRQSNGLFSILPAAVAGLLLSCGSEAPSPDLIDPAASWQKVQEMLAGTKDIIVLDGTEPAPLRYEGRDNPTYGDWMVFHFLSDPENFNPYTSNDAGASRVHRYIYDSAALRGKRAPFCTERERRQGLPADFRRPPDLHVRTAGQRALRGRQIDDGGRRDLQHEGDPQSARARRSRAQLLCRGPGCP